jgi:methyl halide transferase
MNNSKYDSKYWEKRYENNAANWDIGHISTPLKNYIDQLTSKDIRILIPGCGNAYEAQYLYEQGFRNVFVIDLVQKVLDNLHDRAPDFPIQQLILGNYFDHIGQYDLILEQTFISSLEPQLRLAYANKTRDLLAPYGKLAGVLFDFELDDFGPPYGGHKNDYEHYFNELFKIRTLETCYNSIESRQGIELFIILEHI